MNSETFSAVILGTDVAVWTGTRRECEAYIEGAHANSVNPYLGIQPAGCCCGPHRRPITREGDETFKARTGCLACNRWDNPPRLRGEG